MSEAENKMLRLLSQKPSPAIGDMLGCRIVIGTPFLARAKSASRNGVRQSYVVVRCVRCDKVGVARVNTPKSCRCERTPFATHGMSGTRLYQIWFGMRKRCSDPSSNSFEYCGARGIRVCDEWQGFGPFGEWASVNGYSDALQIDRIDNDGNYEPSNCRWVTCKENCRNMRKTLFLEAFGERKALTAWADDGRCVVRLGTLRARVSAGWGVEEAITTLPKERRHVEAT